MELGKLLGWHGTGKKQLWGRQAGRHSLLPLSKFWRTKWKHWKFYRWHSADYPTKMTKEVKMPFDQIMPLPSTIWMVIYELELPSLWSSRNAHQGGYLELFPKFTWNFITFLNLKRPTDELLRLVLYFPGHRAAHAEDKRGRRQNRLCVPKQKASVVSQKAGSLAGQPTSVQYNLIEMKSIQTY